MLFFAGMGAAILFTALWHRQLYSEDCEGAAHFRIKKIGKFEDKRIEESSGLCSDGEGNFFTMNDDTDTCLYVLGLKGEKKGKIAISAKNQDWEEICRAQDGRIFIGDFGNNLNKRKNLRILIWDPRMKKINGRISYRYQDQNSFPPLNPLKMDFDCEAMVFHSDSLWLFTKNRSGRSTCVYALPAKTGNFVAKKQQEIPLLGTVTGASLRPDGKELALLVYRKIYFFSLPHGLQQIPAPDICLSAWNIRQSEAICYVGNDSLLISNEQGLLFMVTRK